MEPERRIEKWLRAFAKKRREQAGPPLELRPATRERLQREVARQSEEKSRSSLWSLFFGSRPRLVFAACFTALAVCGLFLWHESSAPPPAQLAMNQVSERESLSREAIPPVAAPPAASAEPADDNRKFLKQEMPVPTAPAVPPTVVSANRAVTTAPMVVNSPTTRDRAQSSQAQQQTAANKATATAGPTVTIFKNKTDADSLTVAGSRAASKDTSGTLASAAIPQGSNLVAGEFAFNTDQQTSEAKVAPQKSAAPSASTGVALFSVAKPTTNSISTMTASQSFNRVELASARRNATFATAASTPVLLSFRVEQNGSEMKIIDADGSIYTGSVQIAQQEPSGVAIASAAPQNTPASRLMRGLAPSSQTYFFRVAGTNRNLNQNVVFSGNFVPLTNSQLAAAGARTVGGFGGGGGFGGRAAGQPVEAVLTNSGINGTLVIGDQKAVNVVATPVQ